MAARDGCAHRRAGHDYSSQGGLGKPSRYAFRRGPHRRSSVFCPWTGLYAGVMSPPPRLWVEFVRPASLLAPGDLTQPSSTVPRTGRDRAVDAVGCFIAAALGALLLSPELHDNPEPLSTAQVVVDVSCGALACLSLWWRRRWAFGVALTCLVLGRFRSLQPRQDSSLFSPLLCTARSGRLCSSPRCGSRSRWPSPSTVPPPTRCRCW